jgi:hypothetical protein
MDGLVQTVVVVARLVIEATGMVLSRVQTAWRLAICVELARGLAVESLRLVAM